MRTYVRGRGEKFGDYLRGVESICASSLSELSCRRVSAVVPERRALVGVGGPIVRFDRSGAPDRALMARVMPA